MNKELLPWLYRLLVLAALIYACVELTKIRKEATATAYILDRTAWRK